MALYPCTPLLSSLRQALETLHAHLAGQFQIERNRATSVPGLCARIQAKLTAHTLGVYLNEWLGQPRRALAALNLIEHYGLLGIYVVIDELMGALGTPAIASLACVVWRFSPSRSWRRRSTATTTRRHSSCCARQAISPARSTSRYWRRVHALADWLALLLDVLGDLFAHGQAPICNFIIERMPVPACKRVRARRYRRVCGGAYCGYCVPKKETFFGWRVHLVCMMGGLPIAFTVVPGAFHDLTPIHELMVNLPKGAWIYRDKGDHRAPDEAVIRAPGGGVLVPRHRKHTPEHAPSSADCGPSAW